MPNITTNSVLFDGTEEEIQSIEKVFLDDDGKVTFNKIIPQPKDLFLGNLGDKEYEKYGDHNWYDWNCENWGTKWNAFESHAEVSEDKTALAVDFETAWAAPIPVAKKLKELFPSVIIDWTYFCEFDDQHHDLFEKDLV